MPDRDHADVAQAIWQTYAAETGRFLPTGLADTLAAAALAVVDDVSRDIAILKGQTPVKATAPTPTKRGTRLSEHYVPPAHVTDQMMGEFPHITQQEWLATHRMFIDYWIGVPGQRGCKLDWDATWRNWMRKEFSSPQYRRRAPAQGPSKVDRKAAEYLEG